MYDCESKKKKKKMLYADFKLTFLLSGYGAMVAEVKMRSFGEQLVRSEWPGRIR